MDNPEKKQTSPKINLSEKKRRGRRGGLRMGGEREIRKREKAKREERDGGRCAQVPRARKFMRQAVYAGKLCMTPRTLLFPVTVGECLRREKHSKQKSKKEEKRVKGVAGELLSRPGPTKPRSPTTHI